MAVTMSLHGKSAWALYWSVVVFQEDSDDAFDQSLTSDQMITGYQTMKDTRSLHLPHSQNQKQNYTNSQSHYEHDLNDMRPESGYTPRQSMPRTRNRYRPVKQRPTECDDSLFGKPIQEEFKEWKAPWDNSKNVKPLLYDSTDRAGHFSQNKPKTIRQTKSASTRRAWR